MGRIDLRLPRILYGTPAETCFNWKSAFEQRSAREDTWAIFLDDTEDVMHVPGQKIFLSDSGGVSAFEENHFRLYWVHEVLRTDPPATSLSLMRSQQRLILKGMNKAWFALAFLNPGWTVPAFMLRGPQPIRDFFKPLLRALLRHVHLFNRVAPDLYWGAGSVMMPYLAGDETRLWTFVTELVSFCDNRIDHRHLKQELRKHEHNLIDLLFLEGIIVDRDTLELGF